MIAIMFVVNCRPFIFKTSHSVEHMNIWTLFWWRQMLARDRHVPISQVCRTRPAAKRFPWQLPRSLAANSQAAARSGRACLRGSLSPQQPQRFQTSSPSPRLPSFSSSSSSSAYAITQLSRRTDVVTCSVNNDWLNASENDFQYFRRYFETLITVIRVMESSGLR
jgi:hypothetical protein